MPFKAFNVVVNAPGKELSVLMEETINKWLDENPRVKVIPPASISADPQAHYGKAVVLLTYEGPLGVEEKPKAEDDNVEVEQKPPVDSVPVAEASRKYKKQK